MPRTSLQNCLLLLLAVSCVACNGENQKLDEAARVAAQQALVRNGIPIQLDHGLSVDESSKLSSDLIGLKTTDQFDAGSKNLPAFSWIFGGYSGRDVLHFITDRIHFITPELTGTEIQSRTHPEQFKFTAFLTDPSVTDKEGSGNSAYVAINISTQTWLEAAVNGTPASFFVDDQWIPLRSTRAGIVMLGEQFSSLGESDSDRYSRETTLVHEARHSDCGEPLTDAEIQVARDAPDFTDFNRDFTGRSCGYIHILCPPGHELEGIPACDDVPWGGYAVGAIFAEQASLVAKGWMAWSILQGVAADSYSRLLYDPEELKSGRLGKPKLLSAGDAEAGGSQP